jgi:6-pyruvoyltetrahydropterin/6-carboxytetrahydropterin synthase
MLTVTKTMEISASHHLDLPYDSPCQRIHGHNWVIGVSVSSYELTSYGMVVDFGKIKEIVQQLDHQNLNEILKTNPTAENIAIWVADNVNMMLHRDRYPKNTQVIKVVVKESEGNEAIWTL